MTSTDTKRPDRVLYCHWRAREPALLACGLNLGGRSSYRNALGILVAAAGLAAETDQPWTSFSRRRTWYAGRSTTGDLTYDNVIAGMAEGVGAGLFEEDRALPNSHREKNSRQSRYRATPLLVERLGNTRFEYRRPSSSIIMRDIDGRTVDYRETDRSARLRRETDALNEWLGGMTVTVDPNKDTPENWARTEHHLRARKVKGGIESWACALPTPTPHLVRIFGREQWDCNGRLYGWWQSLPKDRRRELLINDEVCIEPDFAQLHPTLLYAMVGATMPRDVYDTGEHIRDHGKLALNILLNCDGGLKGAADTLMWRKDWHETRCYTDLLVDAVAQHNAPIARFLGSDIGVRLMGIDSGMAVDVMKRCRKGGVDTLPVHDSFIAPKKHESRVTAIMGEVLDATLARISPSTKTRHFTGLSVAPASEISEIIPQVVRAAVPAPALPSSPPVPVPPPAPARYRPSPSWDLAERTASMVVYQRRLVSSERLERAPGASWSDWDDRMLQAEALARGLALHEYETGIRTFPTSLVPDRLPAKPKDRLASHRAKAKPRTSSRRNKGRRPQETSSDTFGA